MRAVSSQGGAIDLTASFGSVGSLGTGGTADAPAGDALPIVVDVGTATADNLEVTSENDVFVRQSTGDLRLDKIDSTTGNIRVVVPDGNLVDANNISVPDTQNLIRAGRAVEWHAGHAIDGPDQRQRHHQRLRKPDRSGVSDLLDVPRRTARPERVRPHFPGDSAGRATGCLDHVLHKPRHRAGALRHARSPHS